MVKYHLILFFLFSLYGSISLLNYREDTIDKSIVLSAIFSKDSSNFGDTLGLRLSFKNITDRTVRFSRNSTVGFNHYHPNAFISYDTSERIVYGLSEDISIPKIEIIRPNDSLIKNYQVIAKYSFFYKGRNDVQVFYHHLRSKKKLSGKDSDGLFGSIWSTPIQLIVK